MAATGEKAAALAARVGDGLICVGPNAKARKQFEAGGGQGKPRLGQLHVCWAASDAEARRIAHEWWPNAGLQGELSVELPLPRHFQQAVATVREEDVANNMVCSADPERHVAAIEEFAQAGFDKVYVGQAGPDQEGFFRFYEREVLPRLRRAARAA